MGSPFRMGNLLAPCRNRPRSDTGLCTRRGRARLARVGAAVTEAAAVVATKNGWQSLPDAARKASEALRRLGEVYEKKPWYLRLGRR